jgi:hypothetical protein
MRLGINVPNSLYKRMAAIKHRVNITQVCRDAIEEWVNAYEKAIENIKETEMDEIVNQLKETWEPYVVDWEELGRQDAKIWAEKATPEQFDIFAHNLKAGRSLGRIPGTWMAPIIPDTPIYGQRQNEHEEWFIRQYEKGGGYPYLKAQEDYERGWTSYLIAILNLAKDNAEV